MFPKNTAVFNAISSHWNKEFGYKSTGPLAISVYVHELTVNNNFDSNFITDRIRRMREGNVFSLSTPRGVTRARSSRGVPKPGPAGGYPDGYPPRVPPPVRPWGTAMGVPHLRYPPVEPVQGWVPPLGPGGHPNRWIP